MTQTKKQHFQQAQQSIAAGLQEVEQAIQNAKQQQAQIAAAEQAASSGPAPAAPVGQPPLSPQPAAPVEESAITSPDFLAKLYTHMTKHCGMPALDVSKLQKYQAAFANFFTDITSSSIPQSTGSTVPASASGQAPPVQAMTVDAVAGDTQEANAPGKSVGKGKPDREAAAPY